MLLLSGNKLSTLPSKSISCPEGLNKKHHSHEWCLMYPADACVIRETSVRTNAVLSKPEAAARRDALRWQCQRSKRISFYM